MDWFNKRLIKSRYSSSPFVLPAFFQGDIVPIQIQIVEPNPAGGPNDYVVPEIGSMGLKLAVSATPTGTPTTPAPFVTQFTWSQNTNESYFYADVAFNTTELDTFLGSAASATAYLEIEVTESSSITTVLQETFTIKAQIIETGTLTVAAGQTPLSFELANQLFARKLMNPGETLTIPSPDGTRRRILGCNDDGSAQDDVL